MDTLRADHVGAYGYARPTTPAIDALADRGVLFLNAISQSSWTRPAHLSMLTGLYPSEHGVMGLADRQRLPDDVPTLARALGAAGYATAAFTGGANLAAVFGFDQGFATYRTNGKYFRDNLEDAKRWLEQNREQRFFLFFHGYDAHTPYLSDPDDRQAVGLSERPPRHALRPVCRAEGRGPTRILPFVEEYDGAIRRGDRYVGKLLAHLDELGLRDRTVVVFTSDHGEEFLEHGRCFHVSTLYREVVHVPLVVAGPGLVPQRVPALVPASVSIPATILELVGVERHGLPGSSLAAALAGNPTSDSVVVSETFRRIDEARGGRGQVRALTLGQEKLIHWVTGSRYEHFDLAADPSEQRPITSGGRLELLQVILAKWVSEHPLVVRHDDADGGQERAAEHQRIEQELRALGYTD